MCAEVSFFPGNGLQNFGNSMTDILLNYVFNINVCDQDTDAGIEKIMIIFLQGIKIFGQEAAGNVNNVFQEDSSKTAEKPDDNTQHDDFFTFCKL